MNTKLLVARPALVVLLVLLGACGGHAGSSGTGDAEATESAPAATSVACAASTPEVAGPAYPPDSTAGAYPVVGRLYQRPEGTAVVANGPNDGVSNKYSDPFPGSLGGKYLLFYRDGFVRLKGQGYFLVRWEMGYFNRGGVIGPAQAPTFAVTSGQLTKVALAGRYMPTPMWDGQPGHSGVWEPGYQFLNPSREFTPFTVSDDTSVSLPSLWQNEYYHLDGEVTITNHESGADYNLGITPVTSADVRNALAGSKPYADVWSVRSAVSLDPYLASTRPASPTGLTATVLSDSRVRLSWNDCSHNESGFVVEESYGGNFGPDGARVKAYAPGELYASAASLAAGSTSAEIGSLSPATTYTMRVHAYNDAGMSAQSEVVQFSTPAAAPPAAPWSEADVAAAGKDLRSSSSQSGGNMALRVSGGSLWYAEDGLHFVYQRVTGDMTMTARIVGGSYAAARAGIDVRKSLASDATHVGAFRENTLSAKEYKRGADGGFTVAGGGQALPAGQPSWLRVIRRGNVFTTQSSLDGATWVPLNSSSVPIDAVAYAGLATMSNNGGPTTVTFDNVSITSP